jgi:sugar lactone lactonase YvrE
MNTAAHMRLRFQCAHCALLLLTQLQAAMHCLVHDAAACEQQAAATSCAVAATPDKVKRLTRLLKTLCCWCSLCCCRQGFYYANGVALSADESFLVLVETDRIRAHKVWLKGPKVGETGGTSTAFGSHYGRLPSLQVMK